MSAWRIIKCGLGRYWRFQTLERGVLNFIRELNKNLASVWQSWFRGLWSPVQGLSGVWVPMKMLRCVTLVNIIPCARVASWQVHQVAIAFPLGGIGGCKHVKMGNSRKRNPMCLSYLLAWWGCSLDMTSHANGPSSRTHNPMHLSWTL